MSKKKVLIVSYYWPPAGGISVLRSLKISKYLSKYGWEPVVLTIGNPQYPIIDEENFKHVDSSIKILTANAFQPFEFYKKLTKRKKEDTLANVLNANEEKTGFIHKLSVWIRANFFIPDARSPWIKPAIKVASNYIKENKIDAIFSDGPPHTNTLIACKLSEKFDIPWLMDWQDPWTEVDYYEMFPIGKRADRIHKRLEKRCLKQASAMTTVSPSWKKDAERLGANNVRVIYWGYDQDDYEIKNTNESEKFIISHVGLLGDDRVSEALFKALYDLCTENSSFKSQTKIILVGTVTDKIKELIQRYDLEQLAIIKPQIPRKEALELILQSDINLLLLNKAHNAEGRIPGKLFEYIFANNSILNLGPLTCDVELILKELNIGKTFTYEDNEGIKDFIISKFNDKILSNASIQKRDISNYSIDFLTSKIASILDEITS